MRLLALVCCLCVMACSAQQPVVPARPLTPMEQCRLDAQRKRDSCVGCWWWWLGGPAVGLVVGSICTGQCQQAADHLDMICTVAALSGAR